MVQWEEVVMVQWEGCGHGAVGGVWSWCSGSEAVA